MEVHVPLEMLRQSSRLLAAAKTSLTKLEEVTDKAAKMQPGQEQANYYYEVVAKAMEELRVPVDQLEMIVDKEEWPMPSYGDLLFEV